MRFSARELKEAGASKEMMEQVRSDLLHLVQIVETNRIALKTDKIKKQVPESFAAHAFNRWRRSLREHEVVRLYALWDQPGSKGKASVSVRALSASLSKDARTVLEHEVGSRLSLDAILGDVVVTAEQSAAAVRLVFSGVEAAQLRISNVLGGEPFRRLEEMRHGHIAHRRTKEAIGIRFAQTQAAAIVDEDTVWDLVEETVAIVSAFENVFGDCTDWIEQRAYYRRCGDALWANVVLNIKE